jgi:MoxR-like ATPase
MPTRINIRELLEILEITPRTQNILLVGRHGIGKSQILTDYYTRQGLAVVPLFLGQMSDPGDLLGLPVRDASSSHTVFMPPHWWPLDGRPVALFLDELNRARPEILQSVHDLALNRTLAGRRLPDGSAVLSAINVGEEFQVSDLDPALASRFNVYELAPEIDEWITWARKNDIDRRVVDFIEKSGVHLEQSNPNADPLDKSPDRRAWVRVASLIRPHANITAVVQKAIAGIVGAQAAVAFGKFLRDTSRMQPEDILLHWDEKLENALRATSLPDLVYLNRQILQFIEDQDPKLAEAKRKKILRGTERYIEFMRSGKQTEVVADFINLTGREDFKRAMSILLASPTLMQLLTDYIAKVKL